MKTRGSKAKSGQIKDISLDDIANQSSARGILERLQNDYGVLKEAEVKEKAAAQALPSLLVDGFTEEQMWQQVELQNADQLRRLRRTAKEELTTTLFEQPEEEEEREDDEDQESEGEPVVKKETAPAVPVSDGRRADFFSEAAMEAFCDRAEAEDFLQGDLDLDGVDEDEEKLYYADFFDEPGTSGEGDARPKSVSFAVDGEGEAEMEEEGPPPEEGQDVPEDSGPKSSHQKRAQKLAAQISEMETQNLAPKSWQLVGEVAAESRPQNSLLEEHLAFQHNAKAAPVITQNSTERLEAMLIQRIKDKSWDDVERKKKPTVDPTKFRKELVLDQEKSKTSLAQVYEQEFLKQTQATEETGGNETHDAIRGRMSELFRKLDALCNYHYAPRQPQPELKVLKKTMGSLGVEDGIAPEVAAAAEPLAPEEVKAPGELGTSAEASEADRARLRRRKKKRQREVAARVEAKATASDLSKDQGKTLAKLGNVKRPKLDASAGKGKSFFSKLEAKVQSEISAKAGLPSLVKKPKKANKGAAYKLS